MASLKFPAGCPEALGRSFPRDYTSSMTTMFDGSRTRPPCSSSSPRRTNLPHLRCPSQLLSGTIIQ